MLKDVLSNEDRTLNWGGGGFCELVAERHGRVVQDPMKPTLKVPGQERLKLKCDDLLLSYCFQIQLAPLQHDGPAGSVFVPGRPVQIDPMKPNLKPPEIRRLKLKCDICFQLLLSNSTCTATPRGARQRRPRRGAATSKPKP